MIDLHVVRALKTFVQKIILFKDVEWTSHFLWNHLQNILLYFWVSFILSFLTNEVPEQEPVDWSLASVITGFCTIVHFRGVPMGKIYYGWRATVNTTRTFWKVKCLILLLFLWGFPLFPRNFLSAINLLCLIQCLLNEMFVALYLIRLDLY